MHPVFYVGIDVGSTTIKIAVLSPFLKFIWGRYVRHLSDIHHAFMELAGELQQQCPGARITAAISGSGGLGLSQEMELPFVQEIIAETKAIRTFHPETDVIIELGGEDAKITYLRDGADQRMNGACAGGTGAFIDRMASLLSTDAAGLNRMAAQASQIYPIASRCGVFAKTDIQALLNEGAPHEDIAISVFQSVVNQTLTGLTCGKPIRGSVAFLGGPLTFLPELRKRFQETLKLSDDAMIVPGHGELYVAMGAALSGRNNRPFDLDSWIRKISQKPHIAQAGMAVLSPLFDNSSDYQSFLDRHRRFTTPKKDLALASGPCWLGLDAGSTTIKAVLIDHDQNLLYQWYGNNKGEPLDGARKILQDLYSRMPSSAWICGTGITGYGEALLRRALHADTGEVETMAHYRSARYFCPDVSAILDIGGQDMKYCRIRDGAIDSILLNEACSSGCGSFLDTFAHSLHMDIQRFSQLALQSRTPADLGSRCTVFMNSKVREAQKNGLSIPDIAAGLSYSVIRNALYKVIRLRKSSDMGERVVVQGGTFYNDAVLRAFEKLLGREVIRPDIAGLMGAFGMALIARERCSADTRSSLLSAEDLKSLTLRTQVRRCPGCGNHCLVTISLFSDGGTFVSGNRCERGESIALTGKASSTPTLPNMYAWKYRRLFSYKPIPAARAYRGSVGIPRVLNMYEDYPFWFTFFTRLHYRVVLSSPDIRRIPMEAMETIPSDSECYPSKLTHAHILDLLKRHPDRIWYPCIEKGPPEEGLDNQYHCPMVTSYPESIQANMEEQLQSSGIPFLHPFLPLHNPKHLLRRLKQEIIPWGPSSEEIRQALAAAEAEQALYQQELLEKTKQVLKEIAEKNRTGIVLAGRPYHIDPAVNHGIPELINQLGMPVLTEDGISMLGKTPKNLRVCNQWAWHGRLYRAAEYVSRNPCLELVELNSFGCGLDAVVTDQVQEILSAAGRLYTSVKIDEGMNLGAVKIRLRSLAAASRERRLSLKKPENDLSASIRAVRPFRKIDTILIPEMSPIHFPLIESAVSSEGYHLHVVRPEGSHDINTGLSYVNNDACYPAIITIGSLIRALLSGRYDLSKTALMMSQTGGACRASNYPALLKKALTDAGIPEVPILYFNVASLKANAEFHVSLAMVHKLLMSVIYGDALMRCLYAVRPYESEAGSAESLYHYWMNRCAEAVRKPSFQSFSRNIKHIISDFDHLPRLSVTKTKIGIVGEIYVKFHPLASHNIVRAIEENGGEAATSGLLDFFLYSLLDSRFQYQSLDGSWIHSAADRLLLRWMEWYRRPYAKALRNSIHIQPLASIQEMARRASHFLSLGNRAGEGWFLTADMLDLLQDKCRGIVCLQPFGCLPNHITGKGMMHKIHQSYPESVLLALDCDAGASSVNQLNRLKLLMNTLQEGKSEDSISNMIQETYSPRKGKKL